jgi:hypothetical protein
MSDRSEEMTLAEHGQHGVDADEELTNEELVTHGAEERELLRQHRAEKAEEARRVAALAPVVEELNAAADGENPAEAGDRMAALFIERVSAYGWDRDLEIADFFAGGLRATGYELTEIRNHGQVWEERRR